MDYKILATILSLLFIMGAVSAVAPEITVIETNGDSLFSHRTFSIDFNISDVDTNISSGILIDFNFSSSIVEGTGTVITVDLNLSEANCTSDDRSIVFQCSFSFNPAVSPIIPTGTSFFILALADDQNSSVNTNFDANGSFDFTKLSTEDALCTSVSTDLFAANGCVDEDGFEDATTSALSIGALEFGDSSGLIIFLLVFGILITIIVAALTAMLVLKGKMPGLKPQ